MTVLVGIIVAGKVQIWHPEEWSDFVASLKKARAWLRRVREKQK
jgi:hypothetical protein